MMRRSLARRLGFALILGNLLALVVIAAVLVAIGLGSRGEQLDAAVEHLAAEIGRAIDIDPAGIHLDLTPEQRAALDDLPDARFLVYDPAGQRFAEGSDLSLVHEIGQGLLDEWKELFFTAVNPAGEPDRGVLATVVVGNIPLRIAVVRGRPTLDDLFTWVGDEFTDEFLPAFVPALAITALFSLFAIRRGLAPLHQVVAALAVADPARETVALDHGQLPAELKPLVRAVNAAFDRAREAFDHERRFMTDAAHELKTPVAVLRARLDGLAERAIADQLGRDVDRLAQVVERLLALARMERDDRPMITFDGAELAVAVVAELAPLALNVGRELAFEGAGPLPLCGQPDQLVEALRNLINNALRFAPVGSEIVIAADREDDRAVLSVRDHGPGVDPALADRLFLPFVSSGASGAGHAGLGLAIVKAAAEHHGGSVDLQTPAGGGALFRLLLPLSACLPVKSEVS